MSDLELIQRRFERERSARKSAESLLEEKSRELYLANEKLQGLADRMQEQAEQTQAIVETAAEGIITYCREGRILSFNRSAGRIFQRPSGLGLDIRQLFERSEDASRVLFQTPRPQEGADSDLSSLEPTQMIGKRGTAETFYAEVAVSRVVQSETVIFTALIRDLSRRKKLEARLSQAQKMESVGQLAAGIAHEINTPIQFVGNNIQFLEGAFEDLGELIDLYQELLEAIESKASTSDLVEQIKSQNELADLPFLRAEFPGAIRQSLEGIERVSTIVRAMKEFSKPASEAMTAIDINRAIQNVLVVSTNQFQEHGKIEVDLQPELQPMMGQAGQINQVLLNVLSNAMEAVCDACEPGRGRISISSHHDADSIEIRIADNGPGIPAEIQDRIFDPFFTTKEVGQGTGQGLAFVYDVVVNKHDGTIHALSPPDGGTTLVIRLPIHVRAESTEVHHANTSG